MEKNFTAGRALKSRKPAASKTIAAASTGRAARRDDAPDLGRRLAEIRAARGLTLKELETLTGIAASTLSKVQNGQASLSYENLVRLANGLDIEIAHLFTGREVDLKMGRRVITRQGQGRRESTDRYDFELLCGELYNKHMNPAILEITARSLEAAGGLAHHPGEEFIFVVAGTVEIHSEDYRPVRLETGDSLYLDSTSGHAYVRVGAGPARILAVTTHPALGDTQPERS
jgi:transcriptional regulator with XRE-family HTH domain